MHDRWAILYWIVTDAMMGFGLIGLLSMGAPFLLLGTVRAIVGERRWVLERDRT